MTYRTGYLEQHELTVGEATMPRRLVSANNVASSNGSLRLTYFVARKAETVTQVRTLAGTTAQVGATLCRIGVYEEDASGNLTLVASTASDTTLWVATNTAYTKSFSASFNKKRGVRYAVGLLVVGSTTAPTWLGNIYPLNTEMTVSPRLGAFLSGQTDLPSSVTTASLLDSSQQPYAVLLP